MTAGTPAPTVLIGEAASILNVSLTAIRWWERHGLPHVRSKGNHRRYDRRVILAMRDAMAEGLRGPSAVERAKQLVASGRYDDASLCDRMDRLEGRLVALQHETASLCREVRSRLPVPVQLKEVV